MRQLPLIVLAYLTTLPFGVEVSGAGRTEVVNPADVGTARAFVRGQGSLGPPAGDCSARFDHGTQVLRGSVDVPIDVQRQADALTLCDKFKGNGSVGDHLAVQLVGDTSVQGCVRCSLSASMQVYDDAAQCACQDVVAASGRLEMFGAVKTFGPTGLPYSIESIRTLVGGAGRPAICCP